MRSQYVNGWNSYFMEWNVSSLLHIFINILFEIVFMSSFLINNQFVVGVFHASYSSVESTQTVVWGQLYLHINPIELIAL